MRVISGSLGGRQFESPRGHRTHPMSEKARGALFSALGDIKGLTVLDAFAGSGALSFEAISRGASFATLIDVDRSAISTIVKNAETLRIKRYIKVIQANAGSWSNNNSSAKFDLILCDPPYDQIQPKLLEKLAEHSKTVGIIVYSLPPRSNFKLQTSNFKLLSTKNYGDSQLVFYRSN